MKALNEDWDGDDLSNLDEFSNGTNPLVKTPRVILISFAQSNKISGVVKNYNNLIFDKPVVIKFKISTKYTNNVKIKFFSLSRPWRNMIKKDNTFYYNLTLKNLTNVPLIILNSTVGVPFEVFFSWRGGKHI